MSSSAPSCTSRRAAARPSANEPKRSARPAWASGRACSATVAWAMTPSAPSEPTTSPSMSGPSGRPGASPVSSAPAGATSRAARTRRGDGRVADAAVGGRARADPPPSVERSKDCGSCAPASARTGAGPRRRPAPEMPAAKVARREIGSTSTTRASSDVSMTTTASRSAAPARVDPADLARAAAAHDQPEVLLDADPHDPGEGGLVVRAHDQVGRRRRLAAGAAGRGPGRPSRPRRAPGPPALSSSSADPRERAAGHRDRCAASGGSISPRGIAARGGGGVPEHRAELVEDGAGLLEVAAAPAPPAGVRRARRVRLGHAAEHTAVAPTGRRLAQPCGIDDPAGASPYPACTFRSWSPTPPRQRTSATSQPARGTACASRRTPWRWPTTPTASRAG